MKAFAILLLVGLAAAAPTSTSDESTENELVTIDKDFFPKEWIKYKSEHDIVNILVPLNSLNFEEDTSSSESTSGEDEGIKLTLFFVEADITSEGTIYQGLSVIKDNVVKKLLDNGKDMAASGDDSKLVYLAASDGLYVYKADKNVAEKYGSINDDIIGIAKEKTGDVIYILTADKEVFNVTDNGNKKQKLQEIENAEQIMLDYSNNIYFYGDDKQVNVRTSESVKKITGLPENPSSITLIKPSFLMDDSIPVVIDNVSYLVFANGTSEPAGVDFKPKYKPTAYSMEGTIVQYYAVNKNIYEYNVLAIVLGSALEELKEFLGDKKNAIENMGSNPNASVRSLKAKA